MTDTFYTMPCKTCGSPAEFEQGCQRTICVTCTGALTHKFCMVGCGVPLREGAALAGEAGEGCALAHYGEGATRTDDLGGARYDLIPPGAHRRHAERWGMGAVTHGASNWQQGMPGSVILQHLEAHLVRFREKLDAFRREGAPSGWDWGDDDLAAIAWGAYALMWYTENDTKTLCRIEGERKEEEDGGD